MVYRKNKQHNDKNKTWYQDRLILPK